MEALAPTLNSLNAPQKRALILRDQLRYVDRKHLDKFIDGLNNDEPPTYTNVNGVIKPELVFVTLKEEATRFDLGNVILEHEGRKSVHRVYLVLEDGQIQMCAENPLPLDENVLDSQPILGFIARGMVPLFIEKYQAIYTRMNKINEARRAAYNMPSKAPVLFHEGETLARLDPDKAEQDRAVAHTRKSRKRGPNDEVIPHVSNKRKRAGLDTIPEDVKKSIFDIIPGYIKVDLFNSVARTAFPNFDNLMIASWNVVMIYSSCGSDFPELHTAIVELKGVLQDFDETFGKSVNRATPAYRHDFGGPSKDGKDGHGNRDRDRTRDQGRRQDHQEDHSDRDEDHSGAPVPSFVQHGAGNATQLSAIAVSDTDQFQDDMDVPVDSAEHIDDVAKREMPTPRTLTSSQPRGDSEDEDDDDDDGDDDVPPVDPRLTRQLANQSIVRHSHSRHMAETHVGDSAHTSEASPPIQQCVPSTRDHSEELQEQYHDDTDAENGGRVPSQTASPELARRGEEHASSIRRKPRQEASIAKISAATPSRQKAAAAEPLLVDDSDSDSESDQPITQLRNRSIPIPAATSPPPSGKKQQRDSENDVAKLEKRYKERKTHILLSFQNDMTRVPEKSRKVLEQMEATIEQRKKIEAQKKNGNPEEAARPGTTSNGMFGNYSTTFLGHSVLGPKKSAGVAPVARMLPNDKLPKDIFPNGRRKDPRDGVAKDRRGSTPPYPRRPDTNQ